MDSGLAHPEQWDGWASLPMGSEDVSPRRLAGSGLSGMATRFQEDGPQYASVYQTSGYIMPADIPTCPKQVT